MSHSVAPKQITLLSSPMKGRGKKKEFHVIHLSPAFTSYTDQGEAWVKQLENFTSVSCVEEQMDAIKEVSYNIMKFDRELSEVESLNYVSLAVDLYLSAPLKHPANCALTKTFNLVNQHSKEASFTCFKESLKKRILSAMCYKTPTELNDVTSALIGCYENLHIGPEVLDSLALDLMLFLNKALDLCCAFLRAPNAPVLKVEVNIITHSISRIIIYALQRVDKFALNDSESGKNVLDRILKTAIILMNSPEVPLDSRTNFGFVTVLALDYLKGFDGLMKLLSIEENFANHDEMSRLCICSGLLSGLKSEQFELVHDTSGKTIIAFILDIALLVNEQSLQESSVVLALWRVIQQWTRTLTLYPKLVLCVEATQVECLLNHIWGLLDHYMDSIRHLARGILENVMQLKNNYLSIGIDLTDKMAEAVLNTPETKRGRYVILSTMTSHLSTSEIIEKIPNVINSLLTAMQYPAMSSHVSGAFVMMSTTDFKKLPYCEWYRIWVSPLFDMMHTSNTSEVTALEETLSKIIRLCPTVINDVLPDMNKNLDLPKLRTILTSLKIARKLGVLSTESDDNRLWSGTLSMEVLQSALCHECDEIRLSALALIVDTNRSTEIVCLKDFTLLKLFFEYNVNCEVPSFRQQTLGYLSKLLNRIKDSGHSHTRLMKQKTAGEDETSELLQSYRDFVIWILSFSFKNLDVGSNYSRRICSLKILTLVFDIFRTDDCWHQMWTKHNALTLLNVVLVDTYEENKAMATKILLSFPADVLSLRENKCLSKLFQSGCVLASSIHPSECISAAYLLELCCKFYMNTLHTNLHNSSDDTEALDIFNAVVILKAQLEREADVASKDILQAASTGPMHGCLFCIRHLFQLIQDFSKLEGNPAWRKLIKDVVELCFKVDAIVSPVVNSSSPEGHLPMDFNQGSDLLESNTPTVASSSKVTAQMVLLCSWRTVKEVSLLLGKLSDCCPILPDARGLLDEDQILAIGIHLTTLLEETKHRGAFEQAYVGFSLLAARLWRHKNRRLQELPQKWLNELISAIQSNEPSINKLCATRRSAGVPFMVQALVSAEPQNGTGLQSLQWTMSQLLVCAADESRHVDSRTHALNILRALYRHAPLAKHVAPYISRGVIVAVSGFRGKTWAERNSATLLFSGLMTRIFGVRRSREELSSRNKMTGRVFFHRYPELFEFLLSELKRAIKALTAGDVAELAILHPILLLIARLYPSPLEGTDTPMQLASFVYLVRECASNSVLKTRVLAAQAIVPLITTNMFVEYIEDLVQDIVRSNSENLAHGLSLQMFHLLRSSSALHDDLPSLLADRLKTWLTTLLTRLNPTCSNPVQEVILQIIELIINSWYSLVPCSTWLIVKQKLIHILLPKSDCGLDVRLLLGKGILEVRATRLLFQLLILGREGDSEAIILELLRHSHFEVVLETLVILEKITRRNCQDLNVEAENIIPDFTEGDKHWLERLPADSILKFFSLFCENGKLGPMLASLAEENEDTLRKLALNTMVHINPSVWHSSIDLKKLLLFCTSPHEGTSCAAFACFSSVLKFLVQFSDDIPSLCEDGCRLLKSYCTEEIGIMCRKVAVNFLLQHRQALERKYNFLSDETVCELWVCAIKLTCDDNSEVRSQAASLSQMKFPSVPQKTLESLLDEFVSIMNMSPSRTLAVLLVLSLGPLLDLSNFEIDEEKVFEKGETNMFIEHEILTDLVCKYISVLLSNATHLSVIEWKWVWTALGGNDPKDIISAETLFDAVKHHNVTEFDLGSNTLLPLPIVCSLRRLNKVEQILCNVRKVDLNDCFPFNYDELIGPTSVCGRSPSERP